MNEVERSFSVPGHEFSSPSFDSAGGVTDPFQEYWVDACQRFILTLDVLRQRGNNYLERAARISPSVLNFAADTVMDGRTFERPVNYVLVRIKPPAGVIIDPRKRPFIVFDPRAGQGPGIGGMKPESEIGEVLQAGHPCYFVGFLENPMPGQTVEDVCNAEGRFVAKVAELHREAEGKPCLIGNCQAGWQIMIMSAIRPDVVGPVMVAGAPLSYWAGVCTAGPQGRTARRHLVDRAIRGSRQRAIRRRLPRGELRISQAVKHLLDKALSSLLSGGHGGSPFPGL